MKNASLLAISFLLGLIAISFAQESRLYEESDLDINTNSVFLVKQLSDTGRLQGLGTGVVIKVLKDKKVGNGYEALAVTAAHCVFNIETVYTKNYLGQTVRKKVYSRTDFNGTFLSGESFINGVVEDFDKKNDVALLRIWVPENMEAFNLASETLKPTDELHICGYGGIGSNLPLDESDLRFFTYKAAPPTNDSTISVNMVTVPGDSGGAILNSNGKLVGIISRGWFSFTPDDTIFSDGENKSVWPMRGSNLNPILKLLEKWEEDPTPSR